MFEFLNLRSEHRADSVHVQVLLPQARAARAVMKNKAESAFALLFLINNRSDRALVIWCFGAFFLCFLKFKNANLRTDRFSCMFLNLRTCHRPFFENVLKIKNVPPTVFRIPAPYQQGTPVGTMRQDRAKFDSDPSPGSSLGRQEHAPFAPPTGLRPQHG